MYAALPESDWRTGTHTLSSCRNRMPE